MPEIVRSTRGTAAVEFAIIVPVLLIMLAGLVEIGFAARESMLVQDAAETGAGYAMKYGWDSAGISAAVVNATGATGITASPAPAQFCGCPSASGIATVLCTATCTGGTPPGTYVLVSASITHTAILSNLGLPIPATLTGHATVRLQ